MSQGPAAGPSPVRPSPARVGAAPRAPQPPGSTATRGGKTMLGDKYMLGEELGRGAYGQVGVEQGRLLCASLQALPACVPMSFPEPCTCSRAAPLPASLSPGSKQAPAAMGQPFAAGCVLFV